MNTKSQIEVGTQSRRPLSAVASCCLAMCLGLTAASARADGYVLVKDGVSSLPSDGTQKNLFSAGDIIKGRVFAAKVIIENRSGGTRAVQCQLEVGVGTWIDYANVTIPSGGNTTIPLLLEKPDTTPTRYNMTVNCRVISNLKDGVVAGWAKLHVAPPNHDFD